MEGVDEREHLKSSCSVEEEELLSSVFEVAKRGFNISSDHSFLSCYCSLFYSFFFLLVEGLLNVFISVVDEKRPLGEEVVIECLEEACRIDVRLYNCPTSCFID